MTVKLDPVLVVKRFVDLALRSGVWSDTNQLSDGDVAVLLEIVTAAGFEPKAVVFGKLCGNYREQDGSSTGKTYPINSLCQYKVIAQDGDDDYFATGWLDCAVRRVVFGITRNGEDCDRVVDALRQEIENSAPLQPIQLTADGDLLIESPRQVAHLSGFQYFVKHIQDGDRFGCCVGVHKHCGGWVDCSRATDTHDALVCRKCHLRVLFPKETKTYGELRKALNAKLASVVA